MANQVIVTNTGNVQVALTPPPNVQVQISRAAIGTVSNVPTANFANYAGNVTGANQPNITNVGTLGNLSVSGTGTFGNVVVTGNLSVGNLVANSANYANFANIANVANSVSVANVSGIGNIATVNLDGNVSNVLSGNGSFVALPTVSANANYANYAGNAFNVSGSNVVGAVGLATYATTANAVAGANVSGAVAYATIANSVAGANVSGTVADANQASYASNVYIISDAANSTSQQVLFGGSNTTGYIRPRTDPSFYYNSNANTLNVANAITVGNNVTTGQFISNIATGTAPLVVTSTTLVSNLYAARSNVSDLANSVAVANVSGIGNIAVINLDGNASNILYGNGVFGPDTGPQDVANANYANYAGNALVLANGTSNVSIPTSNGNINFSPNNNANLVVIDTTGVINAFPLSTTTNALRIATIGNPQSDAHRISWARSRGTIASPTSVQANDFVGSMVMVGHNGTSYSTTFPAFIRGFVDSTYTANTANIPLGLRFVVAQTTQSGTSNASIAHNFWSNGNVSFSNSVFAGSNISATGNVQGAYILGDGSNLSSITGANVTGTVANATYAANAGNALILANGTSNISIPTANSNINFSVNNSANLVVIENGGLMNLFPSSTINSSLRINSNGNPLGDAHRISQYRYRGTLASPTSVQPNDFLGSIIAFGHNGTAIQTNSITSIRSQVDSSYTANTANIPIGLSFRVNDTNGGTNNQARTHNFYANGNVTFNNAIFGNSLSVSGNVQGSSVIATSTVNVGTGGSAPAQLYITGDKTLNSSFYISGAPFTAIMDNVNPSTGYSPFFFNTYENSNNYIPPQRFFRARGTQANIAPVQTNDVVSSSSFAVYADSGNTYKDVISTSVVMISNDGAGNVPASYIVQAFDANSTYQILVNNTYANNFTANTITTGSGSNSISLVGSTGAITYNRTFGDFYNSSTITPAGANTPYVLPLGSTGTANNCSIQSTSQLLISRSGNYNLQFSLQAVNADNGSEHDFYVWLRKNGSDVPNSTTDYTVIKNGKTVAALTFNVSSNGSDYYEIAYAVATTQVTFPAYTANSFGFTHPAVPSLVVNLIPVGA